LCRLCDVDRISYSASNSFRLFPFLFFQAVKPFA
jgi:hypothetical protein